MEETNKNQNSFMADLNDFADYSDQEWETELFGEFSSQYKLSVLRSTFLLIMLKIKVDI